jgi:hypothetical protein
MNSAVMMSDLIAGNRHDARGLLAVGENEPAGHPVASLKGVVVQKPAGRSPSGLRRPARAYRGVAVPG